MTRTEGSIPLTVRAIQAHRAVAWSPQVSWVEWAERELERGNDGPSLRLLAGLSPPFNYFETIEVVDAALAELGVARVGEDDAVSAYAEELLGVVVASDGTSMEALAALAELCAAAGDRDDLWPFHLLHEARRDLQAGLEQFFWDGADESNIDGIIVGEARRWLAKSAM